MHKHFTRFARAASEAAGSYLTFIAAVLLVILWAASGPLFRFSTVWQLVINTGTTIITFLMVFLIQNTQNRDSKAIHLKLDELILAVTHARNELIDIEKLTDEQLDLIAARYKLVADKNHHKLETRFFIEGEKGGTEGEGPGESDLILDHP